MRIRKCASKLLGATIGYFSPPPRPRPKPCLSPAWDSQAASAAATAAADAAGILCQLNRSPWDLIPNDQNAVSQVDEDADPPDDDDRGAAANRIKPERKPSEPPLIKSDVKIREEEKTRKKVKRKRMEKGIDATKTGETTAAPLCKKSDGKGWHCKRPANLPHSLCHYHLTQLRSYTNNSTYRKVADQATGDADKHRKKKAAADAAGDGNNYYYYYYSGFGPWRGKRRGSNYRSNNFGGGINGDVDAPVTGDDEEDSEEEEEEEEDKSDDDEEEEEEEGNCRKRGRKPVKARSLKSLL